MYSYSPHDVVELVHGFDRPLTGIPQRAGHLCRALPIPPLPEVIGLYEQAIAAVKPARVSAIALNTKHLDETAARRAIAEAEDATGLVADDVVRNGPERVLGAVLAALDGVT